jgi:hypothetical protein
LARHRVDFKAASAHSFAAIQSGLGGHNRAHGIAQCTPDRLAFHQGVNLGGIQR